MSVSVISAAMLSDIGDQLATRQQARRLIAEAVLDGPQGPRIRLTDGREVLNLCSNDYLGLANDPEVRRVAAKAMERHGFGYAAGRIICGSSTIHQRLESEVSDFLGTDSTQLFNSCFDANVGLFGALLGPEDVVISDELNHASIIDGIRLSKARRLTFPTRDIDSLRATLQSARGARRRMVVTDGVFSMDGGTANLTALCDLVEEYEALLVVDDSHATGVLGEGGRGTVCEPGVAGRVDLITGTFGKALGGAGGGFISGRRPLVDLLQQTARPYVFSNALPPSTVQVARHALMELAADDGRRQQLLDNAELLRSTLRSKGLSVPAGVHPIIPIFLGTPEAARAVAVELLERDILAVALAHPIVPLDGSRIRLQVSAAHRPEDLISAATIISDVVRGWIP